MSCCFSRGARRVWVRPAYGAPLEESWWRVLSDRGDQPALVELIACDLGRRETGRFGFDVASGALALRTARVALAMAIERVAAQSLAVEEPHPAAAVVDRTRDAWHGMWLGELERVHALVCAEGERPALRIAAPPALRDAIDEHLVDHQIVELARARRIATEAVDPAAELALRRTQLMLVERSTAFDASVRALVAYELSDLEATCGLDDESRKTEGHADAHAARVASRNILESIKRGREPIVRLPRRLLHRDMDLHLKAHPDDLAAYHVYRDWLLERGDPRGDEDRTQATRWFVLFRPDARSAGHIEWRGGFARAIRLGPPLDIPETMQLVTAMMIEDIVASPCARYLEELTIGAVTPPGSRAHWHSAVAGIAQHGVPPTLSRLRIHRGAAWRVEQTRLGDLSLAYPSLGRLRDLEIDLGDIELGAIDLPALERLALATDRLSASCIESIRDAPWPALRRLEIRDDGTGDLRPLFEGAFPALRSLALRASGACIAALVASPLLRRLATLELSGLGDDRRALVEHAAAFAHLETFDVS